jgi:AcrR family transcriptional regulator
MARSSHVGDTELIGKLAEVFKDYGYDGASMSILAKASGLQKASLYYRFPGGKEEMAQEVLKHTSTWISENIVIPLHDDGGTMSTEDKVRLLVKIFDNLYQGGKESCLLNMLSHPIAEKGPFSVPIKNTFRTLIKTIAQIVEAKGFSKGDAQDRATHALILLHGGLVLARGTGTTKPFKDALSKIEALLLGSEHTERGGHDHDGTLS